MTGPNVTPEASDVAETVGFLRRFADMMSIGQNATNLRNAAILIETLTAGATAAEGERDHWRHEHATVSNQVDMLEAERDALKHDIDGHLTVISSTLAELDALKAKVGVLEDERSKLRLAFDSERDALEAKVAVLEDERAELRRAFDRSGFLKNQTIEDQASEDDALKAKLADRDAALGHFIVPETTLRQARAQFECLADEFKGLGDIVSQVMCEVGASNLDRALIAAAPETDHGQVALSILAQTSGSTSSARPMST
jgi:chromosome segregation ATPase